MGADRPRSRCYRRRWCGSPRELARVLREAALVALVPAGLRAVTRAAIPAAVARRVRIRWRYSVEESAMRRLSEALQVTAAYTLERYENIPRQFDPVWIDEALAS